MPDPDLPESGELLNFLKGLEGPDKVPPDAAASYHEGEEKLERARLQEEIGDLVQDRDQRKMYGDRLFKLIVCWLSGVFIIVILHGISVVPFNLSTATLTTLIGSATASVIGLFAIVANYLFPKR